MRYPADAHKKLLGKTPAAASYVVNSSVPRRTAAVLPTAIWTAALTKIFGAQDPRRMCAHRRRRFQVNKSQAATQLMIIGRWLIHLGEGSVL